MKAQEIFDISAKHLLTQKKKSENDDSICMYRGPNGTKCAIGCLITDEMYDKAMEGKTSTWVLKHYPDIERKLQSNNVTLLIALQCCHDGHAVENWQDTLEGIAMRFDLDPGVLKTT